MKRVSVLLAITLIIFSALLLGELKPSVAAVAQTKARDSSADVMKNQIVSKEREELDCLKTGNMTLFASLIANDAVFVDAHGTAGKTEILQDTAQFRLTDYTMENVKFVEVSKNSGVISYELIEKGTGHGNPFSAHVFASALWVERAGKWVCLFSQETAAR